ncbi:MAG: sigma-70 family RNA polymerase sigma factor [Armatimonadetes bacterium]|nr:sigma-70 family RNA polymerase sigma factor [Armatimonadota bacterium]
MELCAGASGLSVSRGTVQVDDTVLIEKCRKQDFEAFGKFVDIYESRVHGFVRRMVGSTEDAYDVTQEVFIRAFQNFPRFDHRSNVKTWIFRIAYNLCIDRSRKSSRSPKETSIDAAEGDIAIEVPDDRWDPGQLLLDEELANIVEKAISSMSEKLKSVLLLHDREGASYDEISQVLALPVGTVKSRLFLARAHLQNELKPYLRGETK